MRIGYKLMLAISLGAVIFPGLPARAADDGSVAGAKGESIALKSGETIDLGNLFQVANCKSLLNGPISAEVLEGPSRLRWLGSSQSFIIAC